MSDPMSRMAERIAGEFFNEKVRALSFIVGKGSVNHIAVAEMSGFKAVIRMNDAHMLEDYVKERWCIEQAAVTGIPGPKVLAVGTAKETAYMIQAFLEGDNGEDMDSDAAKTRIWRQLGEYAKVIHTIPVQGYGEQLCDAASGLFKAPPHEGFDGSWPGFIRYNTNSLHQEDRLIELGVITPAESRKAKLIFERLEKTAVSCGLNHGDLSLKNTMVSRDGRVFLIDWGSAEVSPVPYRELAMLLQCQMNDNKPNENELLAFLDGYGISGGEFAEMRHELSSFQMLIAFDKLRWAIDKRNDLIPSFSAYARKLASNVLK